MKTHRITAANSWPWIGASALSAKVCAMLGSRKTPWPGSAATTTPSPISDLLNNVLRDTPQKANF